MLGKLTRFLRRYANRINKYIFRVWLTPRGYGRPKAQAVWDEEYARGKWAYMESRAQLPRYMVIAGFIQQFSNNVRVLELGCGNGLLAKLICTNQLATYVGVDISSEAIRQADAYSNETLKFLVADISTWQPSEKFDVIVFNEVLYYLRDPLRTVQRFIPWLEKGGLLLVCMVDHDHQAVIWNNLESRFDTLQSVTIKNEPGATNNMRVLVPRSEFVEK